MTDTLDPVPVFENLGKEKVTFYLWYYENVFIHLVDQDLLIVRTTRFFGLRSS